jgi:hypothetical protein
MERDAGVSLFIRQRDSGAAQRVCQMPPVEIKNK